MHGDSFSYTVPSGGSNKLLVVFVARGDAVAPTATLNGVSLSTFTRYTSNEERFYHYYAYLANPSSGVFALTLNSMSQADYVVMTLQDAAQTNPIDTTAGAGFANPTRP
jgi:hypothetical protein